jgi:hypothetical protein
MGHAGHVKGHPRNLRRFDEVGLAVKPWSRQKLDALLADVESLEASAGIRRLGQRHW